MPEPQPQPTIRPPRPGEAEAWARFLSRERARTYAGQVPETFEQDVHAYHDLAELEASFADPGDERRLVAEVDGRIVAAASAGPGPADWEIARGWVPAPADQELHELYVHPDLHGTGLARTLLDRVVDDRAHYLWLIDGNGRAGRFYEKHGFRHLDEQVPTGEAWGGIPMHRMVRDARPATAG